MDQRRFHKSEKPGELTNFPEEKSAERKSVSERNDNMENQHLDNTSQFRKHAFAPFSRLSFRKHRSGKEIILQRKYEKLRGMKCPTQENTAGI